MSKASFMGKVFSVVWRGDKGDAGLRGLRSPGHNRLRWIHYTTSGVTQYAYKNTFSDNTSESKTKIPFKEKLTPHTHNSNSFGWIHYIKKSAKHVCFHIWCFEHAIVIHVYNISYASYGYSLTKNNCPPVFGYWKMEVLHLSYICDSSYLETSATLWSALAVLKVV